MKGISFSFLSFLKIKEHYVYDEWLLMNVAALPLDCVRVFCFLGFLFLFIYLASCLPLCGRLHREPVMLRAPPWVCLAAEMFWIPERPATAKGPGCWAFPTTRQPFPESGVNSGFRGSCSPAQFHNLPPSHVTHFRISQPGGHKMQKGSGSIPQL